MPRRSRRSFAEWKRGCMAWLNGAGFVSSNCPRGTGQVPFRRKGSSKWDEGMEHHIYVAYKYTLQLDRSLTICSLYLYLIY